MPEAVKSETFRVTRASARTSAVAAKKASITPMGLPAAKHRLTRRPQASAITASMIRIRPSKRRGSSSRSQESSRDLRAPEARRSVPKRNSAKVITERKTRSSSTSANQRITPGFGAGFIHSETTAVSSKKFTSRSRAGHPSRVPTAAGNRAGARRQRIPPSFRPCGSCAPTPQPRR